jgi:hypothetical protein
MQGSFLSTSTYDIYNNSTYLQPTAVCTRRSRTGTDSTQEVTFSVKIPLSTFNGQKISQHNHQPHPPTHTNHGILRDNKEHPCWTRSGQFKSTRAPKSKWLYAISVGGAEVMQCFKSSSRLELTESMNVTLCLGLGSHAHGCYVVILN